MKRAMSGFSIVELMTALVIMGILLALAMPTYTDYVRNTKVRAEAESFLSGMQLARAEAVRRNATVEFLLTSDAPIAANVGTAVASAAGPNWMIRSADLVTFIEGKFAAGDDSVRVNDTASPASADPDAPPATPVSSVVFNGLGRTTLASDAVFKFTSSQGKCQTDSGQIRCLRVAVSVFGQSRLCDPRVAAGDPRTC